ncbi:MAG TPA: hypothetical protein VHI77_05270 [Solirubrobacterales bacterium]|nr:hypothetical protein [Solirubrobacterales bacterium]
MRGTRGRPAAVSRALAALGPLALGLTLHLPAAAAQVEPRSTLLYATANYAFSGKVWSVHADGSDRRLLRGGLVTGPTGVTATISRDGRRILCLCRGEQIDSMRLDGTRMRQIGRRPKGSKYDIVELGTRGETLWVDERTGRRLLMERPDRSHRRVVATPPRGEYFEEEFAISPAGDRVAFVAGACGRGECRDDVWIEQVRGGARTRAYRTPGGVGERGIAGLRWSRDGTALAFIDYPEPEKYEEPPDPSDHLFVYERGEATEVPVAEPATPFGAFFSPDRSALAVSGKDSRTIYALTLAGHPPQPITGTGCNEVKCLFGPTVFGWLPG